MRYLIYGAGAVGGTIGARLHLAGHSVALICRGDHLAAIRRDGLTLRAPDGVFTARVPAYGSPAEIAPQPGDVALLTMKSHDTSQALDDLEAAFGDIPVALAQNGVANERMAARRFRRVYAMNIALPATFLTPGVVVSYGAPNSGVLDAGRFPTGVDATIAAITAGLNQSGFVSRPVADAMRLKYAKLLINLTNGLDAILGGVPPEAQAFAERLREEGRACLHAASIDFAPEAEYRQRISAHYRYVELPGEAVKGSSTWQSLAKGRRRLEVDYLNGEICLLGALHGVPTPANAAVRQLAQQMAARGEAPGSHTLDEVIRIADSLGSA